MFNQYQSTLEMSKQMIINYENGLYKPSMKTIKKLIKLANQHGIEINLDDFFLVSF